MFMSTVQALPIADQDCLPRFLASLRRRVRDSVINCHTKELHSEQCEVFADVNSIRRAET
jgi:hypothetical protein